MKPRTTLLALGGFLCLAALAPDDPTKAERGVGQTYAVPYHTTETNHYLVRVRLDGKGPFNFLVDTGAPALFVSTDVAKACGITPSETSFWTDLERLDLEGGAFLLAPKCRIEDPFQLISMNALGIPGRSIDGILGHSVLARFRITIDPLTDRMKWVRLDFEPKLPVVPKDAGRRAPADVQAMNLLGPLAKGLAAFVGKQPETARVGRGRLGIELDDKDPPTIAKVWADSPAAKAGIVAGDRLLKVEGKSVKSRADVTKAIANVKAGAPMRLALDRKGETVDFRVVTGEGL